MATILPTCSVCSRRGLQEGAPYCTYYCRPTLLHFNCDRLKAIHYPESLEVAITWDVRQDCIDLAKAVIDGSLRPVPGTPEFEETLTPADYEPMIPKIKKRTIIRL